jgi:predicted lactoylglutathione lyase
MIGYVTLGTNDFDKAKNFYDALLGDIGAKRAMETDRIVLWAKQPGTPMLAVCKPFDEKKATAGNGTMVGIAAESKEQVNQIYAKALELGGTDEGPPGPRGDDGAFYGGYFRDLDGNKLVAFIFGG